MCGGGAREERRGGAAWLRPRARALGRPLFFLHTLLTPPLFLSTPRPRPNQVKSQVLLSATEAAEMILRVDEVVKAAPRPRERE